MSEVRLLVGTRTGPFVLTADGKRENWKVAGPFFAGWECYHVKGSPVDPQRLILGVSGLRAQSDDLSAASVKAALARQRAGVAARPNLE